MLEKILNRIKKFLKVEKKKEECCEEKCTQTYAWIDEKYFNNLPYAERDRITKECQNYVVKMSPVEYLRLLEFRKDHHDNCRHIHNGRYVEQEVPVRFRVITEQTGIGVGYSVICQNCRKCEDLTDYDRW